MSEIIETVNTPASAEKVWNAWRSGNYWDLGAQEKNSFKEGQKGRVVNEKRRGPAFEVTSIEEGMAFTLTWKSTFIKFDMSHSVVPSATGSKIIYKMKLRGLMAGPMKLLLGRKIRRTLKEALSGFTSHIEK